MLYNKFSYLHIIAILFFTTLTTTEGFKCLQCDSVTDVNCISDLTKFESKDCVGETGVEYASCVVRLDENTGKITRGCLAKTEEAACTGANCVKCTEEGCNKLAICKKCDSSTSIECAKTNANNAIFNSICPAADTKCLTSVVNKTTVRRCSTADDEKACATDAKKCNICSGGNCNIGIFPTDRRRCYQCSSGANGCDPIGNELGADICALYEENDKCYTIGTATNAVARGCVSDSGDNKCSNGSTDTSCLLCDKDNCNSRSFLREQTLMCMQCNGTVDENCKWAQLKDKEKNCVGSNVKYNQEDACYSQTKDGTVYRGCFYTRSEELGECTAANNCQSCSDSDGCNSRDLNDFTCIRCRSDADKNCRNNADKIGGIACRNEVTDGNDVCYHGIWNGIVIRGCMVDTSDRQRYICLDASNKQCITCTGKDCNTVKTDGASALIGRNTGLLAFILFITLWCFK